MLSNSPQHPQDEDNSWKAKVVFLVGILLLMMVLLSLNGCGTIRYLDREVIVHDTTKVVVRDSVTFYDRDSVFVKEKGDTVYKYVEKWRFRDRWHTDTLVRVRVDSVSVVEQKIVEVEKPLSGWQKWQIRGFWYLCAAVVLLLCYIFRKPLLALLKLIFKL